MKQLKRMLALFLALMLLIPSDFAVYAAGETVYDLAPLKGSSRAQLATIITRFCQIVE